MYWLKTYGNRTNSDAWFLNYLVLVVWVDKDHPSAPLNNWTATNAMWHTEGCNKFQTCTQNVGKKAASPCRIWSKPLEWDQPSYGLFWIAYLECKPLTWDTACIRALGNVIISSKFLFIKAKMKLSRLWQTNAWMQNCDWTQQDSRTSDNEEGCIFSHCHSNRLSILSFFTGCQS